MLRDLLRHLVHSQFEYDTLTRPIKLCRYRGLLLAHLVLQVVIKFLVFFWCFYCGIFNKWGIDSRAWFKYPNERLLQCWLLQWICRRNVWRSPLITFPRTYLVLKITLDLLMIIEQARAAHTISNCRVKCRLAKLVQKVRDHQHLLLSYHRTQDSCPSGISLYGEIRDRHQSKTPVQGTCPRHQPKTPVLDIVIILHVWQNVHWDHTLWYPEYVSNPRHRRRASLEACNCRKPSYP